MDKKLKKEWEERSRELRDDPKSVMFATFPSDLNKALHEWEVKILNDNFPSINNAQVLDVGAGYGRLSIPLAKKHKDAFFYGMDIAEGFVALYNKKLGKRGKANVASLTDLPYKRDQFDYIFVVTVLMYMKNHELKKAVEELKRVLKKDGKLVVIENHKNGTDYITGFGLFTLVKKILGKSNKNFINSRVFYHGEIEKYFNKSFRVVSKKGCSLITLLIPLYLLFSKLGLKINSLLRRGNIPYVPTLYEAFVFEKK